MFIKTGDAQPVTAIYDMAPSDIDVKSVKKSLKKTIDAIKVAEKGLEEDNAKKTRKAE